MCEWNDMTSRLLFQWVSTTKIQQSMWVLYKVDIIIIISPKCNMFSLYYSWKIAHLAINNYHSIDKMWDWKAKEKQSENISKMLITAQFPPILIRFLNCPRYLITNITKVINIVCVVLSQYSTYLKKWHIRWCIVDFFAC